MDVLREDLVKGKAKPYKKYDVVLFKLKKLKEKMKSDIARSIIFFY